MPLRALVVLLLAGAAGPAWAQDDGAQRPYTLDPVHTRVVLGVEHAGFSQAVGTISGSTGTLRFDPQDWSRAQVDVTVPVQQLDLGDARWNAAVLGANLLDARRHPQARFVSTTVEPVDAQHARVCGDFSLRGVTRPLCLEVTFNALKRHPLPPFRRTAGFSATGTLSRKDYGITAWPTVIGDTVTLRIEAEAVRGKPRGVVPTAGEPAAEADIPADQVPTDSVPPDSVPPDSVPPDSVPPESVPPESVPSRSAPPEPAPPESQEPPTP